MLHVVAIAKGISTLANYDNYTNHMARLARTPIEIFFVVGITVVVFVSSQICQSIGFNYIIILRGVLLFLRVCLIRRTACNDKWIML